MITDFELCDMEQQNEQRTGDEVDERMSALLHLTEVAIDQKLQCHPTWRESFAPRRALPCSIATNFF